MPQHLRPPTARLAIWIVVALSLGAGPAEARTLRVAKDGTGEFTVIQDAVDAAANGDTIFIASGRYPQHRTTDAREACVVVTRQVLTLIGESPESVIIGPETYTYSNYGPVGIYTTSSVRLVRVQGVGLVNNYFHVQTEGDTAEVRGCRFQGGDTGIWLHECDSGFVDRCQFQDMRSAVVPHTSSNIVISNCEALRVGWGGTSPVAPNWSSAVSVRDCTFEDCVWGVFFAYSSGEIRRCRMMGIEQAGIDLAWSEVEVDDCTVTDGRAAVRADSRSTLRGYRNVLSGTMATVYFRQSNVTLRDCHILNAGGLSAQTFDDARYTPGTYDLTGNWWGTTDASQIAAWIRDATDEPRIGAVIQYVPFLNGAVAAKNQTLGGIKGMFR